jgi:hypothetical protein
MNKLPAYCGGEGGCARQIKNPAKSNGSESSLLSICTTIIYHFQWPVSADAPGFRAGIGLAISTWQFRRSLCDSATSRKGSERKVPLVGIGLRVATGALKAAQTQGLFPRYAADNDIRATYASNTIN